MLKQEVLQKQSPTCVGDRIDKINILFPFPFFHYKGIKMEEREACIIE